MSITRARRFDSINDAKASLLAHLGLDQGEELGDCGTSDEPCYYVQFDQYVCAHNQYAQPDYTVRRLKSGPDKGKYVIYVNTYYYDSSLYGRKPYYL